MSFVDRFLPKDKKPEYFLTLKLGVQTLYALVWEVKNDKILIIGRGEEVFSTEEQEIDAADKAIATAERTLPQGQIVEKVLFGLPLDFIDDDKIKPPILIKLKKLTQRLSLVPLGFIELPEALAQFLSTKENAPTSAILVGITAKTLTVSLLRVGKIYESITLPRGENFSMDVEKAIKDLTLTEVLPSRILLYDEHHNLDTYKEELIKHPWQNKNIFLHFPKIETISNDDVIHALIESGASQIIKTVHNRDFTPSPQETEKMVSESAPVIPQKEHKVEAEDTLETLGFLKNQDVAETKRTKDSYPSSEDKVNEEPEDSTTADRPQSRFSLPFIKFRFPQMLFPTWGRMKLLPIIIIILFVILVGGATFWAYWQLPQASVRLIVSSQTMQKNMDITLSPNTQSVGGSNLILPAMNVETEVSGEKSASTSGKKNIGNAAKGTVTIYNKTTDSKSFASGTILIANNLKFTLNSDVTIASASDTGEGLTFGKTDAKITASNIGPESNLPAGTSFGFADHSASSYTAKNKDPLTGGSSRQITAVSKDDQNTLLDDLSNNLTTQAKSSLMDKVSSDEKLMDQSLQITYTNKKFDKEVGAEGSTLTLSLTAKITGLTYKTADFNTLIRDTIVTNIPSGFEFSPDQTTFTVHDVTPQKDGSIRIGTTVSAYLLPKIPLEDIRKVLVGKSLQGAQDYLRHQKNIMGVELTIESPLPFGKDILPHMANNIALSIATK